ncbi:hypothetical protein [Nocardia xishanensis]|nr:hypothetical protein [Nocardia xishanensis]
MSVDKFNEADERDYDPLDEFLPSVKGLPWVVYEETEPDEPDCN